MYTIVSNKSFAELLYIYIYIYLFCNMNIFIYTQLQHKNVQSPDITYLVCPGVKYKNKIKNK